jgi:hypothetical protein
LFERALAHRCARGYHEPEARIERVDPEGAGAYTCAHEIRPPTSAQGTEHTLVDSESLPRPRVSAPTERPSMPGIPVAAQRLARSRSAPEECGSSSRQTRLCPDEWPGLDQNQVPSRFPYRTPPERAIHGRKYWRANHPRLGSLPMASNWMRSPGRSPRRLEPEADTAAAAGMPSERPQPFVLAAPLSLSGRYTSRGGWLRRASSRWSRMSSGWVDWRWGAGG